MSTIKKTSPINNYLIKLCNTKTLPPVESVVLIIKTITGLSIPQIAKKAGVSAQAAYADIKGVKPCPRFRKTTKEVLGCIPWVK